MAEAFNVHQKWGETTRAGFLQIPDVLIKHQCTLGLNPSELIILLNLCMHWWKQGRWPYPQVNTIAKRMGVSARTVVRNLSSLEEKGLVQRIPATREEGVQYSLDRLINRLKPLAKAEIIIKNGRTS